MLTLGQKPKYSKSELNRELSWSVFRSAWILKSPITMILSLDKPRLTGTQKIRPENQNMVQAVGRQLPIRVTHSISWMRAEGQAQTLHFGAAKFCHSKKTKKNKTMLRSQIKSLIRMTFDWTNWASVSHVWWSPALSKAGLTQGRGPQWEKTKVTRGAATLLPGHQPGTPIRESFIYISTPLLVINPIITCSLKAVCHQWWLIAKLFHLAVPQPLRTIWNINQRRDTWAQQQSRGHAIDYSDIHTREI